MIAHKEVHIRQCSQWMLSSWVVSDGRDQCDDQWWALMNAMVAMVAVRSSMGGDGSARCRRVLCPTTAGWRGPNSCVQFVLSNGGKQNKIKFGPNSTGLKTSIQFHVDLFGRLSQCFPPLPSASQCLPALTTLQSSNARLRQQPLTLIPEYDINASNITIGLNASAHSRWEYAIFKWDYGIKIASYKRY